MVGLWGASSLIKSIQRGTVTIASAATSGTATITAVDLANSVLVFSGEQPVINVSVPADRFIGRLELTNNTTVTAYVNTAAYEILYMRYEVIEYRPGVLRSVARGTITTATAASGTATITTVDTTKASVSGLGFTTDSLSDGTGMPMGTTVLTNSTTVTATFASGAPINRVVGYQVLEWF